MSVPMPAPMPDLVKYEVRGPVALVTIDNPPVNALSPGVPEGIGAGVARAAADPAVKAVVVIGAGRTFIAGADIREFGKITSGERGRLELHPILNAIEDCPKPVVMALHGTALGGGLEVAMSGHYRVAVPTAQVGQPEVKLGIIPGAAGTQRLPRLAGLAKAAEMCATGDPISASDALASGIVDRVVVGDLLEGAIAFALEVADRPVRKVRERGEKLIPTDLSKLRALCGKRFRGQEAPLHAIDAVEGALQGFEEGCRREAEIFESCLFSTQSKAMIHAFFGERAVAKIPGIGKEIKPRSIQTAAIIGAGTMGGGIAMVYANAGIPVVVRETSQEALDKGMATIRANYAASVAKGRMPQAVMDQALARIHPVLDWEGFAEADIVVEAVFENLALKKQIFAEIDKLAKPGAVLATNTSTLSIDEIASATSRPGDVIGTHFFSPANVMRLLEVVRGAHTSRETIATAMELAKRLKKVGVLAGNCRGFIGNRMFHAYRTAAVLLAEDGTPFPEIDRALYEWGMAMGPIAVGDLAGLDVGWRIRKEYKHLEDPDVRHPEAEDRLCEQGMFGQKTRAGWYIYDEQRNATPNPEAERIVAESLASRNAQARVAPPEEIVERTIYALVNEGAKILEEGYALRAVDIDVVYLTGYGFPAWRGGPMFYADTVGLPMVAARVRDLFGDVAPLLERLAAEESSFAARDRQAAHT